MARKLDVERLIDRAADRETAALIEEILETREMVLATNQIPLPGKVYKLKMKDVILKFPRESAFSLIELYEESFVMNDHFMLAGFLPKNGDLIVDVGANCGLYALHCKMIAPACMVYCVEPSDYSFRLLQENIAVNSLTGIACRRVAVGENEGWVDFTQSDIYPALSGKALTEVDRPWMSRDWLRTVKVEVKTLNQLFCEFEVSRLDIMKIDVEGSEMEVLRGAEPILNGVDRLVVEYHSRESKKEVVRFCERHGFNFIQAEESGSYYGDLYFTRK